ncbi:MZA anti-phage system associated ATPase MzaB [Cupriavidus gilardii]|uniref:ATP-binding protein n=1 Tax=Cupriavidus gilardii TaxID=82541 RepID=A0ABY4VWZ8_9BURK|nr:MZA anti-phage system associated ATPase MzaB [Cupriavidus gilardii]USE80459.1 ATP-binding protein [Cupriavidus gilardii]UXC36329.1 ATP-binding protein [Cupriavidus gilardii]
MIEALRGLGYSTATALADIVDNSIAAEATHVAIRFEWAGGESRVSIQDDGSGMSAEAIDKAMRLGERNPLEERAETDLGRFGLGLKTASFSQCRRLTVASCGQDGFHCLRWDLDVLANSIGDGWYLLEGPSPGSEPWLEPVKEAGRGTLVLWESLDRIVTDGFKEQDFLDLIDRVEQHLSMVFHRYLEGTRPPLKITINGKRLLPWDPFLAGHPAKAWESPVSRSPHGNGVEAKCHVLPHKDRLSPKEYEDAQGPDGWTSQQGFYVYRNRRLLVAGSWLGLGQGRSWTKDEAHRLARIRLDIPNSADADWKIDIRKSTARPPVALRAWLIQLAENTRSRARRAFVHRGMGPRTADNRPVEQAWRAEHFAGGMRYRIDLDHAAVRGVLDEAGSLLPQVKAMLRVIEETIPVQRIWLDTAENRESPRTGFGGSPPEEVADVLGVLFRTMVQHKGMSAQMARERLLHTDPFCNYPQLISTLS